MAPIDYSLRAETDADEPFLRRLFLAIRWNETAVLGPNAVAQRVAFLNDQFDLQRKHYRTHYRGASFAVIEVGNEPIGRLYVWRGGPDDRIVDISLLPNMSGKGIGGRLLDTVQIAAAAAGRGVSINVDEVNPARRLYARKGFVDVEQNGSYIRMEWFDGSASSARGSRKQRARS